MPLELARGYLTCGPLIGHVPVNCATEQTPEKRGCLVVVLIRDGEAASEGVDDLMCTRLNAAGEIIMMALGDCVLHGEHTVGGIWPLQSDKLQVRCQEVIRNKKTYRRVPGTISIASAVK
jgi:hypothetical protein